MDPLDPMKYFDSDDLSGRVMNPRWAVVVPPPPVLSRREQLLRDARTSGSWWIWAFHQYLYPPGTFGKIAAEDVRAELTRAYRNHQLPPTSFFFKSTPRFVFPYASDESKDDAPPPPPLSLSVILKWTLQRLSGLELMYQIANAKSVEQTTLLVQRLHAEHSDLMLTSGLEGLLRDHISYHFLQIMMHLKMTGIIGHQISRYSSYVRLGDPSDDCRFLLERYHKCEQLLWRFRCDFHADAFRLNLHRWCVLAVRSENATLASFSDCSTRTSEECHWGPLFRTSDYASIGRFSEYIVEHSEQSTDVFPLGTRPVSSSCIVGYPLFSDLQDLPDDHLWYVVRTIHASIDMGRHEFDKCRLWRGYSIMSPDGAFKWIRQTDVMCNTSRLLRTRGHDWQSLIQVTEHALQAAEWTQERFNFKVPRGLLPDHLRLWFLLPSVTFEALARSGFPDNQEFTALMENKGLPASWTYHLSTKIAKSAKSDMSGVSNERRFVNANHEWNKIRETCSGVREIEDLVYEHSPPCMRKLRDQEHLSHPERFMYVRLMTAFGVDYKYEAKRRSAQLSRVYGNDKIKIGQYENEWKGASRKLDPNKTFGPKCSSMQRAGYCPFSGDQHQCNEAMATRTNHTVIEYEKELTGAFGQYGMTDATVTKKMVAMYRLLSRSS